MGGLTHHHVNDWRIIPRVLLVSAYIFTGYAWLLVFNWFTTVDWSELSEAASLAVAAFPAVILGTLTTNVGRLTDNYFRTGSLTKVEK